MRGGGQNLTIVGAGIAGLVCAAFASARGLTVTVVEASPTIGGIWKSTPVELAGETHFLDAGLRLPVATGDDALDRQIFHRPDFRFDWTTFDDWPRESAITAGHFNPESSCLDATVLGPRVQSVIAEMAAAPQWPQAATSAVDHGTAWYGPTLASGLVRDALMGLFETEPEALQPQAVQWFVPRRVVLGDAAATALLHQDAALAERVAHARHADLPKGQHRPFLRPRHGGISTWTNALHASLESAGVRFVLNDGMESLQFDAQGRIAALQLRSGRMVGSDQVVSTVAPALVARAAGGRAGSPPRFRHLLVSHLLVDRAPEHRAAYTLNFNRNSKFLRAIFHDNLPGQPRDGHVITFEHLVGENEDRDMAAEALAECIACGVVPVATRLLASRADLYRNIVPVPTLEYAQAAAELRRTVLDPIANLRFVGRAASGSPFLDQIIREADTAIAAIARVHTHA